MEIRIDGDRSSSDIWMRAQKASEDELPELSSEQKLAAGKFGLSEKEFARTVYAGELGRKDLADKAEKAGRIIQRFATEIKPDAFVESVWLKTTDGKFRFDIHAGKDASLVFVAEDLIDTLLELGSREAEEQIRRIVEFSLPAGREKMRAS